MFAPHRWGLSSQAILGLGERLYQFWQRFQPCFKTQTRDGSEYAYHYLSGLLRMENNRNYANIGRQTGVSGQNVQHFISNSPWSAQIVIEQVQREIASKPNLKGAGILVLDESAVKKAGSKSAGAGYQYNGRLGKVDMSQVGTFLAYVNGSFWTWVDGELFLPEHWFSPKMVSQRQRLGIPVQRHFETKIELGWRMIQRVRDHGLPFEAVVCDNLYGRTGWFRREMDGAGILYMADVPEYTRVYLDKPAVGVPTNEPGQQGRHFSQPRVLSEEKPIEVRVLMRREETEWRRVKVRTTERGELADEFHVRRVWTVCDGRVAQEWLVVRREADGDLSYALSNEVGEARIERLAWLKCQRYFVERANQEAKSEVGWDELQAQKYLAWEHHLAMTVLATWFVAETKLEWAREHGRDPHLAQQFEVGVLPALSVANVRTLLRATMPLPQLTPEKAAALVTEHLVNRTRSRKSRLKSQHNLSPPA